MVSTCFAGILLTVICCVPLGVALLMYCESSNHVYLHISIYIHVYIYIYIYICVYNIIQYCMAGHRIEIRPRDQTLEAY